MTIKRRKYFSKIGRMGGSVTSTKKAASSAANGRRGGRPRKDVTPSPAVIASRPVAAIAILYRAMRYQELIMLRAAFVADRNHAKSAHTVNFCQSRIDTIDRILPAARQQSLNQKVQTS